MTGESITAHVAMHPYFPPSLNLIPAPGGRAFTRPSLPKISPPNRTRSSLCGGRKYYVANAIAIWAMSLKTGRNLPGFATASIPPLWLYIRRYPADSFPEKKLLGGKNPGFRMKRIPGKPKPHYRRHLPVVLIPDDRCPGFAVIKNTDGCFSQNIPYGGFHFFQLGKRICFEDYS